MLSVQDSSEAWERACRLAVEQLCMRYDWQLLEREALAQAALAKLREGVSAHPEGAVIGSYCLALHAACSGEQGAARQNRAYQELGQYLYSMICMRFSDLLPDAREDITQSALERIFKSFERCREPVAFLAFAANHLLDAARPARRQERRATQSLEQLLGTSDDSWGDLIADPQLPLIEQVVNEERRAGIERFLQEFTQAHPRAVQQVAILRMSWLDDLDDAAIGERLGISRNSVYVARSRIIKALQSDPQWRERAARLGLLGDEV